MIWGEAGECGLRNGVVEQFRSEECRESAISFFSCEVIGVNCYSQELLMSV